MVEISEISDRDSLQEWLEALPFDEDEKHRIAGTIAHRAAMRVLPIYWRWVNASTYARGRDLTALPVLRAGLISGVASLAPTPLINEALALIDPEDWEKGPEHVNGLIAGIVEKHRLLNEVRRLRDELAAVKAVTSPEGMRGHNNPPELIEQAAELVEKVDIVWVTLGEAEAELEKPAPDPGLLKRLGRGLLGALKYPVNLADIMAKEAVKSIGKRAGDILILWIVSRTPEIRAFAENLVELANTLF